VRRGCGEVTCENLEACGDCVDACPDVTYVDLESSITRIGIV
jgi:hypothetical protein